MSTPIAVETVVSNLNRFSNAEEALLGVWHSDGDSSNDSDGVVTFTPFFVDEESWIQHYLRLGAYLSSSLLEEVMTTEQENGHLTLDHQLQAQLQQFFQSSGNGSTEATDWYRSECRRLIDRYCQ